LGPKVVLLRVALQEETDLPFAAHRLLRRRDRARTAHRDRADHAREEHRVAHRNQDERVRRQRLRRRRTRGRGAGGAGPVLVFVGEHLGVHAPSFLRNERVSTPSASCFAASSIGAWGGSARRRSKRPYGISRRWMRVPVSRHGNGRSAETTTASGSSATVIDSGETPGSAICTSRRSAASTTSTGGSHVWTDSAPATRKNWRCRRSACSRSESASPHIQLEKSRDLTGGKWRRGWEESTPQELRPFSAAYTR